MQELINNLLKTNIQTSQGLNTAELINYQKTLYENNLPHIPKEYIELLHHFNGIVYNGAYLFGINPLEDFFLDILKENTLFPPTSENMLFLGYNEYDFLNWNQQEQTYQIIDKEDQEVLHSYPDITSAINCLLRINYEWNI